MDSALPYLAVSPDGLQVNWNGELFSFTKLQGKAFALLLRNWEHGTPDLHGDVIRRKLGVAQLALRKVFIRRKKLNKAWGRLIVPGETKGKVRLALEPGTVIRYLEDTFDDPPVCALSWPQKNAPQNGAFRS